MFVFTVTGRHSWWVIRCSVVPAQFVPSELNKFAPFRLESHLRWLNTRHCPLRRNPLGDSNAPLDLAEPWCSSWNLWKKWAEHRGKKCSDHSFMSLNISWRSLQSKQAVSHLKLTTRPKKTAADQKVNDIDKYLTDCCDISSSKLLLWLFLPVGGTF